MLKISTILLATVILISCGKQDASSSAAGAGAPEASTDGWSLVVNTVADLPQCVPTSEGRLAYMKSSQQFMACNAGAWGVVDVKGGVAAASPADGKQSLVKVLAEQPGANCAQGGQRTLSGVDSDGDGILSDKEATTTFVCNGVNGANGLEVASTWKYNFQGDLTSTGPQIIGNSSLFYLWLTDIELQKFTNGTGFVTVSGTSFSTTINGDFYEDSWSQSFFLASTTQNQVITRKYGIVADTLLLFQVKLGSTPVFKAVVTYEGSPLASVKTFPLSN